MAVLEIANGIGCMSRLINCGIHDRTVLTARFKMEIHSQTRQWPFADRGAGPRLIPKRFYVTRRNRARYPRFNHPEERPRYRRFRWPVNLKRNQKTKPRGQIIYEMKECFDERQTKDMLSWKTHLR
jgi:hypothetical protein